MKKTPGRLIFIAALLALTVGYALRYDIVGGLPDNSLSVSK